MISYREFICCKGNGGNTRTADQVQDVSFGMSRNISMLLESKTIKAGCEVSSERDVDIIMIYI